MSIEKTIGGFTGFDIECDICGQSEYLDYSWDNFQGATVEAASSGWRLRYIHNIWECVCSDCQEKEEK